MSNIGKLTTIFRGGNWKVPVDIPHVYYLDAVLGDLNACRVQTLKTSEMRTVHTRQEGSVKRMTGNRTSPSAVFGQARTLMGGTFVMWSSSAKSSAQPGSRSWPTLSDDRSSWNTFVLRELRDSCCRRNEHIKAVCNNDCVKSVINQSINQFIYLIHPTVWPQCTNVTDRQDNGPIA